MSNLFSCSEQRVVGSGLLFEMDDEVRESKKENDSMLRLTTFPTSCIGKVRFHLSSYRILFVVSSSPLFDVPVYQMITPF